MATDSKKMLARGGGGQHVQDQEAARSRPSSSTTNQVQVQKQENKQDQGSRDFFVSVRDYGSRNVFESMVFSQFPEATPGCKRWRLFLSVNSACHLAESGFSSNESIDQLNRLTGVIPYELIKGKLRFKAIAKSEHKAGDNYQADLCITFEKDLYLSDVFQNLKDDDVRSMWPLHYSNESFKSVFVKSGDAEITSASRSLNRQTKSRKRSTSFLDYTWY